MLQKSKRPIQEQAAAPPAGLPDPLDALDRPPQQVRVIAGADVQEMDLVGRTVGEGRTVALALFGIRPDAEALVDGRNAREDQVLGAGQVLVFVKHAGQKGAADAAARKGENGPVIELSGEKARWGRNGAWLGTAPLADLLRRTAAAAGSRQTVDLYPRHVRLMVERAQGATVGVVVEMPPGPREVKWAADGARGMTGRAQTRCLSFPWVILLLVFRNGEISNVQQAFYRTRPLASLDDELYYTNLLNVARGYGLESWLCLVNLGLSLRRLSWEERIRAVTEHFWAASFNRSAEAHEGNSYWQGSAEIDPRLATAQAWDTATRSSPYFALEVKWRRSEASLGRTLDRMLDAVSPSRPIERVDQLVTLLQQGAP
jgi:hypothetical protein